MLTFDPMEETKAVAHDTYFLAATNTLPPVELIRSSARRSGASARAKEGRIVVRVPMGIPVAEESAVVHDLVAKVLRRNAAATFGGDEALARRARDLNRRWLDGDQPDVIRFSHRMDQRWGSCTPATRTIRIASQVAAFPDYVLDGVIVHELAHLQLLGHGPRFWELVHRYPDHARAEAYLAGAAKGLTLALLPSAALLLDQSSSEN